MSNDTVIGYAFFESHRIGPVGCGWLRCADLSAMNSIPAVLRTRVTVEPERAVLGKVFDVAHISLRVLAGYDGPVIIPVGEKLDEFLAWMDRFFPGWATHPTVSWLPASQAQIDRAASIEQFWQSVARTESDYSRLEG